MHRDEIEIVAKIMLTADGWCSSCSSALIEKLKQAFPEHAAVIDQTDARSGLIEMAYRAKWEESDYQTEPRVWEITLP